MFLVAPVVFFPMSTSKRRKQKHPFSRATGAEGPPDARMRGGQLPRLCLRKLTEKRISHTRHGGSETTVTTRRAAATAATDNCRTTFRAAAAACNPQIADGSGGARAWPPRMLCEVKDEVLSRYSNFDGKKWLNKWGICKNLISQLKSELLTLNDS